MRIVFINADPPEDFSFSAAIYTDEGFKTYDARNLELFGNWKWTPRDEYSGWRKQSPVSAYTYALAFKFFGVNFFSVRAVSIAYSFLTLIIMYFFMKRNYEKECALLCSAFFAVNFFLIMYNRLGLYETHLNFYLMAALFFFTEAFGIKNGSSSGRDNNSFTDIFIRLILMLAGIASLILAYFIKKSILIVPVSLLPVFLIIYLNRIAGYSKGKLIKGFTGIFIFFFFFYGIFSNINKSDIFPHGLMANTLLSDKSLTFASIPVMIGKALFLEGVFFQPLTFLMAFVFAVYSIYRYFQGKNKGEMDFILSCWLIFVFILLTTFKYNPARYYMLVSIPLVILCARSFFFLQEEEFKSFILKDQGHFFGSLKRVIAGFSSAYFIISAAFQIIPFKTKKYLMHWAYREADSGFPHIGIIVLTVITFITVSAAVYFLFNKKYLRRIISYPGLSRVLASVILITQISLFGKWAFFHSSKMHDISTELRHELEPEAVIAGSWAAGFALENRNPALVLQQDYKYNRSLLESLILGKAIPINSVIDGKVIQSVKKDVPVYIAVSPGTTFERIITESFSRYLRSDNLFKVVELGYFDVFIYKISSGIESAI